MSVSRLLREWRTRRLLSQLELSGRLGVSARHLSFVETGRANASRALLLQLAAQLEMPLRVRNELLLAAGYAPAFTKHSLGEENMWAVRAALDVVLTGHEPYPAIAVDENFNLVAANRGCLVLLEGVAARLLEPPLNVMRMCLHPEGLAPRLVNLGQARACMLARVRRAAEVIGLTEAADLYAELVAYPAGEPAPASRGVELYVPLRLRLPDGGELTLLNTIATFGTALDVTVEGLALESFFPADPASAEQLRRRAEPNAEILRHLVADRPDLADYLPTGEQGSPKAARRDTPRVQVPRLVR